MLNHSESRKHFHKIEIKWNIDHNHKFKESLKLVHHSIFVIRKGNQFGGGASIEKIPSELDQETLCHNHRPQTNPRHREEETQSTDTHTSRRTQLKKCNHFSLPLQEVCKTTVVSRNFDVLRTKDSISKYRKFEL